MPNKDNPPPRPIHWIASVLLPLAVLGVALAIAGRRDPAALSAAAQATEDMLREADAELVVIGASHMDEAVDIRALGERLGEGTPVRVASLAKGATMPPVWYVLARERLFEAGFAPRVLIVGSTPKWLMETAVSTQGAETILADHLTEYDPVLAEKSWGQAGHSALRERIERLRAKAQTGFQALVREWSVGLVFGDGAGSLAEQGRREAEPALARVFGAEGAVDMRLHERVIPVVEEWDAGRAARDGERTVAASFVPDLVALARAHGTRLVFLWIPVPDIAARDQELPPALYADLVRTLNGAGAGRLDLHDLYHGAEMFRDLQHMSGRERFTRELAEVLREMDVLGTGPLPPAEVPFFVGHAVRREGTPTPPGALTFVPVKAGPARLEALREDTLAWSNHGVRTAGLGPVSPLVVLEDGQPLANDPWCLPDPPAGTACHLSSLVLIKPRDPALLAAPEGHFTLAPTRDLPVDVAGSKGWFVYPGTTLAVDLEGATEADLAATVTVILEALGPGAGGPAVEIGGRPVTLTPRQEALVGEAALTLPADPWSVHIAVPPGGPMVLVRWLAVEARGRRLDLMGSEALASPPVVDLLERARQGEATVRSARLPTPLAGFTPHPELPVGVVQAPDLAPLSNGALVALTHCPTCSPLRLREDGALLEPPSASCPSMMQERVRSGRFCQEGAELRAVGRDGGNPGRTGRAYTVEILPRRVAPLGFWIAPGDSTDLPTPGWRMLPLRHGASSLHLEGFAVGGDPALALELALELGGEEVFRAPVPAAGLAGAPLTLAIDPPLPASGKPLVLHLASPDAAPFVLLMRLELRE